MNEGLILLSALAFESLTACVRPELPPKTSKILYAEPPETTNKDTDPYEFQKLLAENMKKSRFNESEYTKEAALSQKDIVLNYSYLVEQNGKKIPETLDYAMSSTMVDLGDYYLAITAAHGLSPQIIGKEIGNKIPTQNLKLEGIKFGNSSFVNTDQLGIDFIFNLSGSELDDFAVIVIPKNILSEDDKQKIGRGAISPNAITFDEPNTTQDFYGICQPDPNLPPIEAVDAHYIKDIKNLSIIENWPIDEKCSGAGLFKITPENNQQLAGIAVRYFPEENNGVAATYLFSTLGKENFEAAVQRAIDKAN